MQWTRIKARGFGQKKSQKIPEKSPEDWAVGRPCFSQFFLFQKQRVMGLSLSFSPLYK
jgi:hypothetical protein